MKTKDNFKNIKQLFLLRNLLITGQVFSLLLVYFGLNIQILSLSILLIITSQILFNAYVWKKLKSINPIADNEVFFHLLFDVLCLAVIFYFLGGATNPFIILFLFPLTIAVTILPTKFAWGLATATIFCYSLLMVQYESLPINLNMHDENNAYGLHIIGMWIAFVGIATLITFYVFGIRSTVKQQKETLDVVRKKSFEDEQLISLGTASTNTSYKMANSLTEMAALTTEIKKEIQKNEASANDLALIDIDTLNRKIDQCQNAITDLSFIAKETLKQNPIEDVFITPTDATKTAKDVAIYLQDVLDQIYVQHPNAVIDAQWTQHSNDCVILSDRILTQALMIALNQPLEKHATDIQWFAQWNDKQLDIEIISNSLGTLDASTFTNPVTNTFSSDTIKTTPPYFQSGIQSHKEVGIEIEMDLGMLLAQAIFHRMEGNLQFLNMGNGKTCIKISLPLISH